MKKLLIATAVLFTALPFTFEGITPAVSKAHAIIGRPGTPMSFAGVHRRHVRHLRRRCQSRLARRLPSPRRVPPYLRSSSGAGSCGHRLGRRLGRLGLESSSL